ncbi:PEP-CTERM sorting domain-containing protein [Luteolibacter marinus]|uniref:PEP-CTERM sorting domain-containing protein n=1 Tax=Luteolibacter marinus TaxID=2776705 RepID=UPI001866C09C|nr:PEP-CTERM sorting domain-containing protein [Luteolibacter marinus]
MKYTLALMASVPLLLASAPAVTLLTDDFTVSSNSQDVNQELAGRQTGTLATSTYTGYGTQHQVGNSTTDVGQPGGAANSNFLLLAFNSSFHSDLNVATLAAGPLTIEFDMYLRGTNPGGNPDDTNWGAFALRAAGEVWPIAGGDEFGMLVRANGGVQTFQGGNGALPSWDTPGLAMADHWTFTFTNTAGTGSAFDGSGSQVTVMNGATTLGTISLNQLNQSNLVFGFRNYNDRFIGIDNLSVSTVPEPSGLLLLSAGAGLLTLRRRRA